MKAIEVYQGSDGELTKAYYAALEKQGPIGIVAVNLFRAQKCSARAKVYRGGIRGVGRFKDLAYERKGWSLQNLAKTLGQHGAALGISFGWGKDPKQEWNSHVLYIDLPVVGQVSFHSPTRYEGPDYPGEWDGQHQSESRVVEFCEHVYHLAQVEQHRMFG